MDVLTSDSGATIVASVIAPGGSKAQDAGFSWATCPVLVHEVCMRSSSESGMLDLDSRITSNWLPNRCTKGIVLSNRRAAVVAVE